MTHRHETPSPVTPRAAAAALRWHAGTLPPVKPPAKTWEGRRGMAKHRSRTGRRWLPSVTTVAAVAALAAVLVLTRGDGPAPPAAAPCTPLRVVAASPYVPVLTALAPGLGGGAG